MKSRILEHRTVMRMLEHKLEVALVHNRESVGWLIVDGKKIVRFSLPGTHGAKPDLSRGAADKLIRDSRVHRDQLYDLIDCPLSRDEYVELLREQGLVDQ